MDKELKEIGVWILAADVLLVSIAWAYHNGLFDVIVRVLIA